MASSRRTIDTPAVPRPDSSPPGDSTGKSRRKNMIERIRHFTPSWYAVTMGTGVLPVLIHNLPYGLSEKLYYPALVILCLNICLVALFTGFTLTRYIVFPGIFKLMILHSQQSLFVGCIPMGMAVTVNGATSLLYIERGWGGQALLDVLWGFYWFDTVFSTIVCIGMLHVVSKWHAHTLETITAVVLLPFVPPCVSASLGAVVGTALAPTHPDRAMITLFVSYASLGLGLPIAILLLGAYTARLFIHGPPPRPALTSVVLPLGPLGTGGLAFVTLGQLSRTLFNSSQVSASAQSIFSISMIGDMMYAFGVLTAFIMWGFGIIWLGLGISTVVEAMLLNEGPRFGMPWWGLTFPLGVYGLLTFALGAAISPTPFAGFMNAFGTGLTGVLFLIWLYVGSRTVYLGIEGSMFDAPCLMNMEKSPMLLRMPFRNGDEAEKARAD